MSRNISILIGLVSAAAAGFIIWLVYVHEKPAVAPAWASHLAWVNAFWNSLAATSLVVGYRHIRAGRVEAHRRSMLTAVTFSTLFLITYLTYHHFHGDARFLGQGIIRPIYFTILISHIGLSVIVLPLVLVTLYLGLSDKPALHRRVARWTLPMWLYVAVTGVAIVVMVKAYA